MISFDFTVRIEDRKFRFSADLLSERIAILGRSGAGKSTLAKALAGLLKPESGYIKFGKRILFDSSTGVDLPPQKRGIGFVFQNHRLFPFMSVRKTCCSDAISPIEKMRSLSTKSFSFWNSNRF